MRSVILLILAVALAACQPRAELPAPKRVAVTEEARIQERLAFERWVDQRRMVDQVSLDLLYLAKPLCDRARPGDGFKLTTHDDLRDEWKDVHAEYLGLAKLPKVTAVSRFGPAFAAGLRVGDEIVSVDGVAMKGEKGDAFRFGMEARRTPLIGSTSPWNLIVRREGRDVPITVPFGEKCWATAIIENDDTIGASIDDQGRLKLTTGLLDFVNGPDELALVIGHELAHRNRDAVVARDLNEAGGALAGMVVDVLFAGVGVNTGGAFSNAGGNMGKGAYSPAYEAEADYLGLYLAAQAGYGIDQAPEFWRRIGTQVAPSRINHGTTHPSTAYRAVAMQATVAEIKEKMSKGEPLVPSPRSPAPSQGSAPALRE